MFYLFFSLAFVVIITSFCLCKYIFFKKNEKFNTVANKILKIAVVTYCVIVFLSILLPDAFMLDYEQEQVASTPPMKSFLPL